MTLASLWPNPKGSRAIRGALRPVSVEDLEAQLEALFPDAVPVVTSSARVALVLALRHVGLSRPDTVALFPYASHCVIDATGWVATPVPQDYATQTRIVLHQWGVVQAETSPVDGQCIEDAVDTLCAPGTSLMPRGGRFEVWSLPKILGTLWGGVLWCTTEDDAQFLRLARDQGSAGIQSWALRLAAQSFSAVYGLWRGIELEAGRPSRLQCGELALAINRWDQIWHSRKEKEALLAPWRTPYATVYPNRLGPVVPMPAEKRFQELCRELGLLIGYRHIQDSTGVLRQVMPVPIHQDISLEQVSEMAERLKMCS